MNETMKILTYYGKVTETKAQSIVRDLRLNQHEGDESFYTYRQSPTWPNLFYIVALTLTEEE